MSYNCIRYEVSDRILTLTLNRPDLLNAFSHEMGRELIAAFNRASDDDAVGAIVVTGAGRGFCAGMDMSGDGKPFSLDDELQPTLASLRESYDDPQTVTGIRDTGGLLTLAIFECKKPVIAAINGAAVGIGATMTCAMDVRLASDQARAGFVFNKVGITPEGCSSWFLPRVVNMGTALEWIYRAELIAAEEMLERGFVSRVVPADRLLAEARTLAGKICRHSPVTVALTRQMLYRNAAQPHPRAAHEIESLAVFYCSRTSGREGVQAFREKRTPVFREQASTDMPPFYPWW